jgi:hypothetical protein
LNVPDQQAQQQGIDGGVDLRRVRWQAHGRQLFGRKADLLTIHGNLSPHGWWDQRTSPLASFAPTQFLQFLARQDVGLFG